MKKAVSRGLTMLAAALALAGLIGTARASGNAGDSDRGAWRGDCRDDRVYFRRAGRSGGGGHACGAEHRHLWRADTRGGQHQKAAAGGHGAGGRVYQRQRALGGHAARDIVRAHRDGAVGGDRRGRDDPQRREDALHLGGHPAVRGGGARPGCGRGGGDGG